MIPVRCSVCGKIVRKQNKSKLCAYHAVQDNKKKKREEVKTIDYSEIDDNLERLMVEVEFRVRNIKVLVDDLKKRFTHNKPNAKGLNSFQGKE